MRIRGFVAILLYAGALTAGESAEAIMARVAANIEKSAEARKQYVYQQRVRTSLIRSDGQPSRKEDREYSVLPGDKGTEKKLVSFKGEYRKGKTMVGYSEPDLKQKKNDIDGEIMEDLTDNLVNDKQSRDGIPHNLFPLRSKDLPHYRFSMKGEIEHKGRRTYQILFEPLKTEHCIHVGSDDNNNCGDREWKGEAWIDAAEFQPVRIDTQLAFSIPWGVRVFLGTNFRQMGFSVTYTRVGEDVWFPATYGTEFRFNVLWGYRRTITLAMESSGFQKTDAVSKIEYDLPK
jgi:hypothetical protein